MEYYSTSGSGIVCTFHWNLISHPEAMFLDLLSEICGWPRSNHKNSISLTETLKPKKVLTTWRALFKTSWFNLGSDLALVLIFLKLLIMVGVAWYIWAEGSYWELKKHFFLVKKPAINDNPFVISLQLC